MNILLRLSIRPTYWRIAVILPGRILWRTYSRVEYPTPDEAVRRCLAGLVGSSHQQHEPCPRAAGQSKTGQQHVENDHAERVQGEDHKIVSCRAQSGWSPSVNPKSRTAQTEKNHGDDHSHCGNPDDDRFHLLLPPGCIQPQTDQRPEECRHGHAEPQHRLPAVESDEATQHPRPLPPVWIRAAWWGWL